MPRTLNPEAHAVRRDAFVDVAQRLIQIEGLRAAERPGRPRRARAPRRAPSTTTSTRRTRCSRPSSSAWSTLRRRPLAPIVDRPEPDRRSRSSRPSSRRSRQWKAERKELMLGAPAGLVLGRQRDRAREAPPRHRDPRSTPLLAAIVRQGSAEGVVHGELPRRRRARPRVAHPGRERGGQRAVRRPPGRRRSRSSEVERTIDAYNEAFERILGLPAGSLDDRRSSPTLRLWFG